MGVRACKYLLIILLLSLATAGELAAQWTKGPQVIETQPNVGAIAYKDGLILAGAYNFTASTDSGRTWIGIDQQVFLTDIAFRSRDTAVISTIGNAISVTTDGGKTWTGHSANGDAIYCVRFGPTIDTIYASAGIDFLTSTDQGASWMAQGLPFAYSKDPFAVANDGTVYIEAGQPITGGYGGSLFYSKCPRMGIYAAFGTFNDDCYSIALDSCDQRRIYIANEDTTSKGDGTSNMYYSTDAGGTWQSGFSHKRPYMNGALAIGQHAIYAGTLKNGIIRSTDQGVTWKNIGGPSNWPDCRYICAINDNIVIAFDQDGYIWSTFNSGGDSVRVTGTGNSNLTLSSSMLFAADTISCDSLTRSILFNRTGCSPPSVSSALVIGMDSASFNVSNVSPDSIQVTLRLLKNGDQHAQLVLALDNGSYDTVSLAGHVNLVPDTLTLSTASLFASDTISCDSLTYPVLFNRSGCSPPNVVKDTIVGVDSVSFKVSGLTKDSVLVTLYGIKQGDQHAKLVLTLDNGLSDTVGLLGHVNITPLALTLSTQDVRTDTLGATVAVPITINGLEHAENIDLVLHYDGSVEYLGSFSPTGIRLDIQGDSSLGRSELAITGATSGTVLGYAKFNVFNDSSEAAHATFDSVTVIAQITPCQYSMSQAATSTITTRSGCGILTLSQLIHLGKDPHFSILPNPTNGNVWVSSSEDIGDVTVQVYDMVGTMQSEISGQIGKNNPFELLLPPQSGVYNIVLRSSMGTRTERVIRIR
jgi:photosystem II stability/assembly factor-like uncharacterized protein